MEQIETMIKSNAIIDRYDLGNCEKNLKEFEGRKRWGRCGEALVMEALRLQIIPNFWYTIAPDVIDGDKKGIYLNAKLGDIYFGSYKTELIEHIDVKNTMFVSDSSIDRFIDGGWYFFNAFANSGNVHFMIKNTAGFREWIKQFRVERFKSKGYEVDYWKIPDDKAAHGIEILDFDPAKYQKLIMQVRTELEVLRGLKVDEIDKSIPKD